MSAKDITGTYRLVTLEAIRPNGEVTTGWLGAKPTGLIVYDSSGYMSVQIMKDPQEASVQNDYYAYFGTYEIDEKTETVIHHVEGSLHPDEVGVSYIQAFTLLEDRLILTTAKHPVEGEERRNRLVLTRVKAARIESWNPRSIWYCIIVYKNVIIHSRQRRD